MFIVIYICADIDKTMTLSGSALDWANRLQSCRDIKIALKAAMNGNYEFK